MTSRSVTSRKNSVSFAQRFAHITELVETYRVSTQVVQHSLSHVYKALNQKKILSPDICISLLNDLADMSKPLSCLCSAFEELANLPDTLVPFHLEVFMALSNIQRHAKQVESYIKKYYEHIIVSKPQDMSELRRSILRLIKLLRAHLDKVNLLLKNALGRRNNQSQENPPLASNREDGCIRTTVLPLATVSDPSHEERTEMVRQRVPENGSSVLLSGYKSALNQRLKQLAEVEMRKAKYADLRNIPPDLQQQEEDIRKDIRRLNSEIAISEQVG